MPVKNIGVSVLAGDRVKVLRKRKTNRRGQVTFNIASGKTGNDFFPILHLIRVDRNDKTSFDQAAVNLRVK